MIFTIMPRSSKRSHPKRTKSTHMQVKSTKSSGLDEDREKVEAAIFFLRCQEWMTRKYVKEIRITYLNPLDELCSGKKRIVAAEEGIVNVESVSKSMERSSSNSARKANKIDGVGDGRIFSMDKISEKLQQGLKVLQRNDGEMAQSYRPVTREKTVSLADCCALYRLKTVLEAVQELLDIQTSLDKWFENNKTNMNVYKSRLKNLLTNALTNFEMAYIITELFAVQQVPRQEIQKIKPEYSKYIRPDIETRDITIINKPLDKGIAMIIDNLPPKYRFPETIYHLSSFAKKLLANAPPSPDSGHIFSSFLNNSHNSSTNSRLLTQASERSKSCSLRSHTGMTTTYEA
ncbi:hypothetical protein X798_00446 [Onchocerca flexuosa]|uniref:Uncharacterized protein n=1 Tax=Onchocerca flexuosa TaxID=387005 RepID=A0A238C5T8_9BILA|nr:hypothetical protein X798_00446 [Onchocerca flexuosa]